MPHAAPAAGGRATTRAHGPAAAMPVQLQAGRTERKAHSPPPLPPSRRREIYHSDDEEGATGESTALLASRVEQLEGDVAALRHAQRHGEQTTPDAENDDGDIEGIQECTETLATFSSLAWLAPTFSQGERWTVFLITLVTWVVQAGITYKLYSK
jgi:hypothetical protein